MKNLFKTVFIALLAVLSFTSCEEDINFGGDTVQTPIVFCLLNQADSVHYLKLTRTFSGDNNAVETALIADSNYFQQATVKISERVSNTITRTWILNDTVLTNKEPGVFYSPEQMLYYFTTTADNPLRTDAKYLLDISVNNGEFTISSETELVNNISVSSPNGFASFSFMTSSNGIPTYANSSVKLGTGNAKIMDARLQIYIDEFYNNSPTAVQKSFEWKLGELNGDQIQGTIASFPASGQTFYTLMRDNCTNDPAITKRQINKIVLIATGGTDALSKYILVNEPSSSLAQSKPTFTNLVCSDGRPVIGLFSARHTIKLTKIKWENFLPYPRCIDKNSMKELCIGSLTGNLLFCSDHPVDISAGESWICD